MSKHNYMLAHQAEAREAFEEGLDTFKSGNALLSDLRKMFDWMAQEEGATKIASRKFKQRLPEIHKKFPQLAMSFTRMDENSDCWLTWEEFASFCLKDEGLKKMLKRSTSMTVYGLDGAGTRTYKDFMDPAHMCETSIAPPLLPWEKAHVVEWRIEGLKPCYKGAPCIFAGKPVVAGSCFASPPFRAAGVNGYLRFWPAGYWTETQRRRKAALPPSSEDIVSGGANPLPPVDSWCCVGAVVPTGTHLVLRFFVGDAKSPKRECFWSEGNHAHGIWAPPSIQVPKELIDSNEVVVGLEIIQNLGAQHGKPKIAHLGFPGRHNRRPQLRDLPPSVTTLAAGGRSQSLPLLGQSLGPQSAYKGKPKAHKGPPVLLGHHGVAKSLPDVGGIPYSAASQLTRY